MNSRTVASLLALLCLLLAAGWVYRHYTATTEKKRDVESISYFSNGWAQTSVKLEEQKAVNLSLEHDLSSQAEELKAYSNNLVNVNANLAKVQVDAKTAADQAKEDMRRRDARIAELESERDGMTQKMNDLTNSISHLETQIAETQHKLDASEGDREFLLGELKRLQKEKAELERQFNDLALLREQVHRLRDELSISRRLEWIRRGLYGNLKGGELLRKGLASAARPQTNYNLDVEIRRDGGARVLPGTSPGNTPVGDTNTPATKP